MEPLGHTYGLRWRDRRAATRHQPRRTAPLLRPWPHRPRRRSSGGGFGRGADSWAQGQTPLVAPQSAGNIGE